MVMVMAGHIVVAVIVGEPLQPTRSPVTINQGHGLLDHTRGRRHAG